jgi:hypothetical protein
MSEESSKYRFVDDDGTVEEQRFPMMLLLCNFYATQHCKTRMNR